MEVSCKYYFDHQPYWFHKGYVCEVTSISGLSGQPEIRKFLGVHERPGKNDGDVIYLEFDEKPLKVFPRNLSKKFPNLRFLKIKKCEIGTITRNDLIGLENLECLSLYGNNLTTLPDDLFADMKNLRRISFYENKLECLSSKLLQPIENKLEFASFEGNLRINENLDVANQGPKNLVLLKFKKVIDQNCLPPKPEVDTESAAEACTSNQHQTLLKEFANFRASGKFTDFTITFRGKEYKVHKCILAAQSSVFKEMFTDDLTEASETSKKVEKIETSNETVFASFLDYFYTGIVDDEINSIEMLELAMTFGVPHLQTICCSRVLKILDQSNALEIFNLGHKHLFDGLKQAAFKIIQESFPNMYETFIDKPEDVNFIVTAQRQIEERLKRL